MAAVRPDETVALRDFVLWNIKHRKLELVAKGQGSTFTAIGQKDLSSLQIPLPSLDEQRQIVSILNRAAKIERLRKQVDERLREFIPALFVKLFGDPVENPMGWRKYKLGNLGRLDRGRSKHRPRNAAHLYGGRYPFIQTGDIATSNGKINHYSQTYSEAGLAQSRLWPSGTLCVTIAANIGMTGILTFDGCFPDSVVGFTPDDRTSIQYIQTALDLMRKHIEERAPQSAQRNINLKVLRELEFPVPPFEQQCQYAEIIEAAYDTATIAETASQMAPVLSTSFMATLLGENA